MGPLFAILAAVCNSTIGIFSKISFHTQIEPAALAFFRCLLAFLAITIVLLFTRGGSKQIAELREYSGRLFLTSFFGVFVLYYFEIWALSCAQVPIVSFLLYASGIIAVILGILWLKETINVFKTLSTVLVLFGMGIIFLSLLNGFGGLKGGLLAVIAGGGYSIFLVLMKKYAIPANLATLWWLFGFGSLLLFIPFALKGFYLPNINILPYIICLALIPTIGGFYCTNKALSLIESGKVQLFEMSEPVFATVLAFIILGETMSVRGILGSAFTLIGLLVLQQETHLLNLTRKLISQRQIKNKAKVDNNQIASVRDKDL